ncbi:WhiB family transcriptional regulator [Streptacidiphilus sp. ASG 303]|uniref:WhiB family transcriptional regulator n=1 Tax=Streptomycetaceae TaxID=2062 RepID=UPI001E3CFAE3|nr:WhiB family transcriptional regulator [Streptacidiphilus sp. ASG 303]MCD0480876.1 WhiB family transcriptional regulator [Streptacidiphilus sp. ASG 303]
MWWWRTAACVDKDPDLFFPVGSAGPALVQLAEAKAVCAGCPVARDCLEWALRTGQEDGVWGGMTADERRGLRNRRLRRLTGRTVAAEHVGTGRGEPAP